MAPVREAMIELVERGDIVGFMDRDKVRWLHKEYALAREAAWRLLSTARLWYYPFKVCDEATRRRPPA
jgi:hypothetical protein